MRRHATNWVGLDRRCAMLADPGACPVAVTSPTGSECRTSHASCHPCVFRRLGRSVRPQLQRAASRFRDRVVNRRQHCGNVGNRGRSRTPTRQSTHGLPSARNTSCPALRVGGVGFPQREGRCSSPALLSPSYPRDRPAQGTTCFREERGNPPCRFHRAGFCCQ